MGDTPHSPDDFSRRIREALGKVAQKSRTSSGGPALADAPDASPGADRVATPADVPAARQPDPPQNHGPVGTGEHVVKQGECVSSIASASGHFWETIWNDAQNAELREIRRDPYVLLPGDRVHVPPLRPKSETGQSEMRHRFRRKGQPEMLRIRVLADDEPRRNEPYEITIDGQKHAGVTDADGKLSCPIDARARRAVLRVGADDVEEFVFELGELDPIDELSGVQGRLSNLGFHCWNRDGTWSEETEAAIRKFQHRYGLDQTGRPDEPTRAKLKSVYGC